jgi:pyridoxamine 5'-phosphate oxidase
MKKRGSRPCIKIFPGNSALNPIDKILSDRTEARKLRDTNADICFLALADANGKASVRTLVLREIVDNRFTLFINKSSPKWKALSDGAHHEMLIWYASMQRQYRISGTTRELDPETVKSNWHRRPIGSKYLDYVYEQLGAQSTPINSRQVLTDKIKQLKSDVQADDMKPPSLVAGIEIIADRIEMLDLNKEDRIHDRQVHTFDGIKWSSETLIP